jgi:hypothetical protein
LIATEQHCNTRKDKHSNVYELEKASLRCRDSTLVLTFAVNVGLESSVYQDNDSQDKFDEHSDFITTQKKV